MDIHPTADPDGLPEIPRLEVGGDGPSAARAVIEAAPQRFAAIFTAGRAHYGAPALWCGDRLSRRWLARNENPYLAEIDEVAARAATPGAYLLNLSYEWTCTSGVGPDPGGRGSRLLRTLDWPLDGLGRNVVVVRRRGDAGVYHNVTWPGFVGVATAMAPGRFSAAINQPPMRRHSVSCWLDWTINRAAAWRRRALPPAHLLRRVFDSCGDYQEAKAMLSETPLAMPAFFSLSGTTPEQGCVIERETDRGYLREAPASVANHWIAADVPGRDRGVDSPGRWRQMEALGDAADENFAWVRPPILNPTTRLSVSANAATGALSVQGWEEDGAATALFRLSPVSVETAHTRPSRPTESP